jgi:hypothetical protein
VRAWDPAVSRRHGAGEVVKAVDELNGGDILVYRPARQAGAWLEFPLEVAAKEPLRLELSGMRSPDGGLYQAFLDGVKIGETLDFRADPPAGSVFPLLDFWPVPGPHVLRLVCVGKSLRSFGFACGIEAVRLLERRPRVAEYGHDKDKDWKKNPRLYY